MVLSLGPRSEVTDGKLKSVQCFESLGVKGVEHDTFVIIRGVFR